MTYEETVELEANIKMKDEANRIYADFIKNIKLELSQYQGGGKFKIWSDSHNAKYVVVHEVHFEYICNFLHENYSVVVTPEKIFDAIVGKSRVVEHLEVDSRAES